ncbi:MAG: hypothetical protein GWN50_07965 [Candidatus Dadabacteria bacterium]|nr:hypothetical protein [Candidatus Dadabacteria bacterium]
MNKRQRLSEIAGAYGKNISSVINEVLDHYIELHKWQLKHITRGVKEPGSGKFVKEKEVEDFFKSHT